MGSLDLSLSQPLDPRKVKEFDSRVVDTKIGSKNGDGIYEEFFTPVSESQPEEEYVPEAVITNPPVIDLKNESTNPDGKSIFLP